MRQPLTLPAHLERALEAMEEAREASLPAVRGLSAAQVARWLLRVATTRAGRRWPLLLWPGRVLAHPAAAMLRPVATGAWLVLEDGEVAPRAIQEVTRGIWRADPGPAVSLAPELLAAVYEEDRHHAVEVDPALDVVRRALLAHCEGAGVVWISGSSGSGRRSLAAWAHARLGEGPLTCVTRGGRERASPGRWALFEELSELGPAELTQLEARLEMPATPLPPRASGPARPDHPALQAIVGESPELGEVLRLALAVAPSPRPALILGEPGVGKEGLARALHVVSGRSGPFHAVDLGAVPEDLMESELFGHARGAFTGADRARLGAFRAAEAGTLLLDEVGNLSLRMQARLLRVLQERVVRPVGEDRPVSVSARVVAATNADLASLVRRGEFREDLYQRLSGFTLRLPPLRERQGDVLLLARHLLARERGAPPPRPWASEEVEAALLAWRWPGNVRELEGRMALAAALCPPGGRLELAHLGEIDPARRPAPTLVTGDVAAQGNTSRRLWSAVSAVGLALPGLADRPEVWRRDRVLLALEGVAVAPDALDALTYAPWWGGFPELNAAAAALRALVRGRASPPWVTLDDLHAALPDLAFPGLSRPIIAIIDPHLGQGAVPIGLTERFWTRSVVLGRVHSLAGVSLALEHRPADQARLAQLLHGETPGFLRLGWLVDLPRVAAVISRGAQGLRLTAFRSAHAEIWAGELRPGAPLRRAPADGELALGPAAELQIREPGGRVLLDLLLAEGAAAMEEHVDEAVARLREGSPAMTRRGDPAPAAEPPERPRPTTDPPAARSRWVLGPDERRALNGLLLEFPGGVLKSWALERVSTWAANPDLRRLASYLREAPNLADYLGRLYELDDNEALRVELLATLEGRPDAPRLVARWPSRMQRIVESSPR